jgi:hypothetical protein
MWREKFISAFLLTCDTYMVKDNNEHDTWVIVTCITIATRMGNFTKNNSNCRRLGDENVKSAGT